jgi:hypothetical protein
MMRVGERTEVEKEATEEGRLRSSWRKGRLERVAETGLVLVVLCTLERRELDPTGFRWMRYAEVEGSEDIEFVRESCSRISACAGTSILADMFFHSRSASEKSGRGESLPSTS